MNVPDRSVLETQAVVCVQSQPGQVRQGGQAQVESCLKRVHGPPVLVDGEYQASFGPANAGESGQTAVPANPRVNHFENFMV